MLFRPSIPLTVVLALLALLFGRLGSWQLERMAEKEVLVEQFEHAPVLPAAQALSGDMPFARIEARGRYDVERHILRDNRILNGLAGVHVFTPFQLDEGPVLLVNRGWLPLPPDRGSLPPVPTTPESITITGMLRQPPGHGPRLGAADKLDPDNWPQLVTYFDLDMVAAALQYELSPWIVQLDQKNVTGFEGRQWEPAVMKPATHGAYALQWFSLSATAVIIWLVLGIRRGSARQRHTTQ